ncbi:MAG: hypothetical protein H7096_13330 [Flavobacterium sp.]|nr:hypothetical protein [Pedobacter sp.]
MCPRPEISLQKDNIMKAYNPIEEGSFHTYINKEKLGFLYYGNQTQKKVAPSKSTMLPKFIIFTNLLAIAKRQQH